MYENSPVEIDRPVTVKARINIINNCDGVTSPPAKAPTRQAGREIERLTKQIADLQSKLEKHRQRSARPSTRPEAIPKTAMNFWGKMAVWFKRQPRREEESP